MWNGRFKFLLKICEKCGREFKCASFRPNTRFCSRVCFHTSGVISANKDRSEKIRQAMLGRIITTEWRKKISISKKGKKTGVTPWKGKTFSLEHRKKISEAIKKAIAEGRHSVPHYHGKKNQNWRGGISDENHLLRTSKKFRTWREAVYKRDDYTCQKCGDDKGGNLHPHHIKFWHEYPKLRFIISNGLTVCKNCHRNIHRGKNYGKDN